MSDENHGGGVLVIVTGGTVCLLVKHVKNAGDKLEPASLDELRQIILDDHNHIVVREGRVESKAMRVDFEDLRNIHLPPEKLDSAQVNPKVWSEIADMIRDKYYKYEGFVVLHGLDTMAYSASALSFILGNLHVPVILTGSQRPLNYGRTDAVQNIRTSITFAGTATVGIGRAIPEVVVYSHDTLFRGNRVTMQHASSYRCFDTPNFPELSTAGEFLDIKTHLIVTPKNQTRLLYMGKIDAKVEIIDVYPGMHASVIESLCHMDADSIFLEEIESFVKSTILLGEKAEEEKELATEFLKEIKHLFKKDQLDRVTNVLNKTQIRKYQPILELVKMSVAKKKKVKGVVLRTYGMGTAPTSPDVLKALNRLVESGIIVLNVTQAQCGRISHGSDPVSLRLFEHGVVSGGDMTSEAALAKLVIVLSNANIKDSNPKKVNRILADMLQIESCGEQSQSIFNLHFGAAETSLKGNGNDCTVDLYPNRMTESHRLDEQSIKYIQFRILGLKSVPSSGSSNKISIFSADLIDKTEHEENIIKPLVENLTLKWSMPGDTLNFAFDITNVSQHILSPDIMIRIKTNDAVQFASVSCVLFAKTNDL